MKVVMEIEDVSKWKFKEKKRDPASWKSFVLRITILKHMTRDLRIIAKGLSG